MSIIYISQELSKELFDMHHSNIYRIIGLSVDEKGFLYRDDEDYEYKVVIRPNYHPSYKDLAIETDSTVFYVCRWGLFLINSDKLTDDNVLSSIGKLMNFKPYSCLYPPYSSYNGGYVGLCPLQKEFLENMSDIRFYDWNNLLSRDIKLN